MLTCKQLYREHWRKYYGDNIFIFQMDVFREFAQQMPRRCWQNIRKVAFKMPHRHHHEGIWKMLGTMRSLHEIQLWMGHGLQIDETVRDAAVQGVKNCQALDSFSVKRLGAEEDEFVGLNERDEELQSYIDSMLKSKKTGQPIKKSSPPKLERRRTDPFTLSGQTGHADETDQP